jgi:hypothetical protein
VIVLPGAAHTAGSDVVGNHIAIVSEPLLADTTNAVLSHNLAVKQLPHLAVGGQFAVSARVLRIVDVPATYQASRSYLGLLRTGESATYFYPFTLN